MVKPKPEVKTTEINGKHILRADRQTKMGSQKAVIIVTSIGLVAIIIGLTVGLLWSLIFNMILEKELVLTPTSKSYQMWKETPIPMYLKIHLFNWTNPEKFTKTSGVKPNFVETGPYVFREVDYKINKVWNDNGTVTFQQKRVWHFIPEMSNGSLDDKITNLNAVAATVAHMVRYRDVLVKIGIDLALKIEREKLTVTKSVGELLFKGYDDRLMAMGAKYNITGLPFDKFGWMYGRNESETADGTFNVETGSNNLDDLGSLMEWNYSNKSKYYKDSCGTIKGTLGDLWPPLTNKKTVTVFAPDICSSLSLEYNNMTEYAGLNGYEYTSSKDTFDNGTNVPSRACFCKDVECQPSGAFNVSQCKFGAPAFVSLPHFYMADESYRSAIDGMHPRKEDHQFSMIVEPNAGIPMKIRARLQLNMLVQPDPLIGVFSKVPRTYIPILWFTQEGTLTEPLANQVKFMLTLPMLGHVTFFGIAGIGFLLVFIGLGLYIRRRRQAEDGQSLIPKSEPNGTSPSVG